MSDSDVKSYKQIKDDLDGLRLLVEKSELWVYKSKTSDGGGGGDDDKDKKDKKSKDKKDGGKEESKKKVQASISLASKSSTLDGGDAVPNGDLAAETSVVGVANSSAVSGVAQLTGPLMMMPEVIMKVMPSAAAGGKSRPVPCVHKSYRGLIPTCVYSKKDNSLQTSSFLSANLHTYFPKLGMVVA